MVTDKDIEKIAGLAQIYISDTEKEEYRQHFEKVLNYMKVIFEVPTKDVAPMYHPEHASPQPAPVNKAFAEAPPNPFAEAQPNPFAEAPGFLENKKIISMAPDSSRRFFKVPPLFNVYEK